MRLYVRLVLAVSAIIAVIGFVPCVVGTVLVVFFWHTEPHFRSLNHDALTPNALRKVRVVTPDGPVAITVAGVLLQVAPAPEDRLRDYLPMLAEELAVYPTELMVQVQLNHVVLCTHLSLDAKQTVGLVDFGRGDLYLDVNYLGVNPAYARKTIHHEFFHLLDNQSRGNKGEDADWAALNPPEFRYGEGGRAALSNPNITTEFSDLTPGFLSRYSTSDVEEDKAEVFAFLIVRPNSVAERVRSDPVVRAKVARIKAQLIAFSPDMDNSFWERVNRVRKSDE